jgi:hypothetical protein
MNELDELIGFLAATTCRMALMRRRPHAPWRQR